MSLELTRSNVCGISNGLKWTIELLKYKCTLNFELPKEIINELPGDLNIIGVGVGDCLRLAVLL